MVSPSTAMKKRGSWSLFAGVAAEMVNSLELNDGDFGGGPSSQPPQNTQGNISLPAMTTTNRSSSMPILVQTKRRGSETINATIKNLFTGDGEDKYDPSTIDLKTQAKQPRRQSQNMFSSLTIPTWKPQARKDPLIDFHERHNKAHDEFKRQEAEKRRQQLRDHDDNKSLSSSNSSFFDFLAKDGAADELLNDGTTEGGGIGAGDGVCDVKRRGSTASIASFFSLFGDDEAEISKLSSAKPVSNTEQTEEPSLQDAVNKSKSVKGQRLFIRGGKAAEEGDWEKAVAYYHIALVKQRKYYGEDHIVTSNTLNSLGLALMNLGEYFGALTALEEALHIRQEKLGAGAEEAAETTSNISMVLKASQEDNR
mmetsp:Transcript_21528/g.46807  ORF Transcript_21528/g.46807 Transcript_21528/m.46807 type:complete len:367 (-) Transcript_21528:155-1255(-)|eukprot:CAMPEP_0172298638 /NCGR_PEP_ID=MMETSP1058-20130122/1202_1 /TAXON_ID=83371 /ORGANISM="Detonula confervacea, Strain CCMP 353" /LENGTH=366 /DNA_ID=CAMNT_0013007919 /DNA_START=114 /DNA_END=1214 /DNA_ORIENTATION=-